jgi:hypothetical protein
VTNRERLVALSNAERQRNHKDRLKQRAAEGLALADLMLENQRALEKSIVRLERVALQLEGRVIEHIHSAVVLSLPPEEVERLAGMKEFRSFGEDGSTEPEILFLGMSAQQWATMPRELLEVFGLTDVVAAWTRQADGSITGDNERQPKNEDIEEYLTQAPSPEGEEVSPFAEIAKDTSTPSAEITSPKALEPLDFQSFHKAYRQWLDEFCPFSARTPERVEWAQENKFSYDGTCWSYIGRPKETPVSPWPVRYDSDDGRTLIEPIKPEDGNSDPTQIMT